MGGVVPAPPLTAPPAGRRTGLGVGWGGLGILLACIGWAAFRLLSALPSWAETVAGSGVVLGTMRILSLVTGVVPFALAELLVLLLLLRWGLGIRGDRRRVREGALTGRDGWARSGLRAVGDAGVVVFLFYLLWGVQYSRPGIEGALGVVAADRIEGEELERLLARAVRATNALYLELHGVPDTGAPTPPTPVREASASLEEAWGKAVRQWGLPPRMAAPHGKPKTLLSSGIFRRLGISGVYFPFTGEALVLRHLPGVAKPRTMAHEMAHQRGVASESDANVLAFLVAREADDPRVRYAAHTFLQSQWTNALRILDPTRAYRALDGMLPGVARDLDDQWEYWEPARGRVGGVGTRVNHALLRSHGIPEGVRSYRGSAGVFVALARERGADSILPE